MVGFIKRKTDNNFAHPYMSDMDITATGRPVVRQGSLLADTWLPMRRLFSFVTAFVWPDIAGLKLYQSCCLNIYENRLENNVRVAAGDRLEGQAAQWSLREHG
ncbi:hypothetical protein XENORESO_008857 [Xenotaenia resolanae]|uniref:Uncharacterized protein n=1 Tax=Xenotaenia resolanae TaxID=208358 RepID=A0ABV0W077_9TELE